MVERNWSRDPWDYDPRFDARSAEETPGQSAENTAPMEEITANAEDDAAEERALADTVRGRLMQLERILGELLGAKGDDLYRVTLWETNPQSSVRNPHLDAITIPDDYAIARGRLN